MSAASSAPPDELPPPRVEEVSPGIFAYIQLDGSWWLNNTGFLVGSDRVVVIDTCATESRTRAFLAAVGQVTDLPLRMLVCTHHHGDHTHGNYLVDAATVIGHHRCREQIMATSVTAVRPVFPTVDWGHIEPAPPFVTFDDRLRVWVDDLAVELVHVGPAHTDNDVIAWVPDRRLLFSGDLVFNGGTPFVMMGSVSGALEALDRLRALEPEAIVPGHGSVCGPEVFDRLEEYLRFVADVAGRGKDAGLTPLEAAQGADLSAFAGWHDAERIAGNLHRAYAELDGAAPGAPLDYGPIFADMIAWNGGRLPRCLA